MELPQKPASNKPHQINKLCASTASIVLPLKQNSNTLSLYSITICNNTDIAWWPGIEKNIAIKWTRHVQQHLSARGLPYCFSSFAPGPPIDKSNYTYCGATWCLVFFTLFTSGEISISDSSLPGLNFSCMFAKWFVDLWCFVKFSTEHFGLYFTYNIAYISGFEIRPIRLSETCQNISGQVKCPYMVIRRTSLFFIATWN